MFTSDATVVRTVRRLFTHRDEPGGASRRGDSTRDRSGSTGSGRPDAEPDLSAGLRACPACDEQVHVYAVRCRHCGQETEQLAG